MTLESTGKILRSLDQDEISEIVYFAALMLEAQDEKEWIEQVISKLKKANLSSAE